MSDFYHVPHVPMFNIPEIFGKAMSYEGQIHAICHRFGEITESYNDTLDYINSNFPWKFADPIEWDIDTAYEPYTVVYDSETFSSYVSLKDVPSGTPLTDTEYWAKTADYNGQVQNIENDIDNIENDIDTLSNRSAFYGKKILCITDSWGNENGIHGVTTCWLHLVCNWLKADYIDLHQGSTGYMAPPTYQTRFEAWAANNTDILDDIAYVFVCGSINDHLYTHVQISTAIAHFIDSCRQLLPNAIIVLFAQPMGANPYKSTTSNAYNSWARVCYGNDYYMAVNPGKPRTIYVPDTFYSLISPDSGIASLMDTDMIHPTQAGQNKIARFAYQALTSKMSKQVVQQLPIIRITNDNSTFTQLENLSTFNNITVSDNVLTGTTQFKFTVPSDFTVSASSKLALNIPRILPVSQLTTVTMSCQGIAEICDINGNVAFGYVTASKYPYNIPDNSSDDSNIWMNVIPNRNLTNFSGAITVAINWHINLTIANSVY